MPNTREKLIELLNAVDGVCPKDASCYDCEYKDVTHCAIPAKADYLIAHGVTVQEWISVKDRLPEKNDQYLCNYHFGEYPTMTFTQVLDYYATDIVPHFQHTLGDGSMKVTHWMPLPQPPKGE